MCCTRTAAWRWCPTRNLRPNNASSHLPSEAQIKSSSLQLLVLQPLATLMMLLHYFCCCVWGWCGHHHHCCTGCSLFCLYFLQCSWRGASPSTTYHCPMQLSVFSFCHVCVVPSTSTRVWFQDHVVSEIHSPSSTIPFHHVPLAAAMWRMRPTPRLLATPILAVASIVISTNV